MHVPPRFVVVDDKKNHLQAILDGFQKIGTPCIGINFNGDELDRKLFRGVRGLFLDLHLTDGAATTDQRRHFAQITAILEDNIHESGGPFILVIWTEHPHYCVQLKEYLDAKIDQTKPYARPIAILTLPKHKYIDVVTGEATAPDELKVAIQSTLEENPQLLALLGWETDIISASGDTLSSLVGLVPSKEKLTTNFPAALDIILSRLAREAVGRQNVEVDHRAAISTALAPILMDRILNQGSPCNIAELWAKAITRANDRTLPEATPIEAGKINRMLHLAVLPEPIRPTDWGAVVDFPGDDWSIARVQELFGVSIAELLGQEFKINKEDRKRCRPCLVRIGGACDYAQQRRGPIKYLFGLEIPVSVTRLVEPSGKIQPPASEWESPVFVNGQDEPFRLHVNVRFHRSVSSGICSEWMTRYRIREQLLVHLISHDSTYGSRIGIVQLPIAQEHELQQTASKMTPRNRMSYYRDLRRQRLRQ